VGNSGGGATHPAPAWLMARNLDGVLTAPMDGPISGPNSTLFPEDP
jgi:hypothetical protein